MDENVNGEQLTRTSPVIVYTGRVVFLCRRLGGLKNSITEGTLGWVLFVKTYGPVTTVHKEEMVQIMVLDEKFVNSERSRPMISEILRSLEVTKSVTVTVFKV